MSEVCFEVFPGLTSAPGSGNTGSVHVNVSLQSGETLSLLLARLSLEGHAIGRLVFDAETDRLKPRVEVLINRRILSPGDAMSSELKEGDHVTFVPAFAGG
jgi:molybdopterin converting factor small subunit